MRTATLFFWRRRAQDNALISYKIDRIRGVPKRFPAFAAEQAWGCGVPTATAFVEAGGSDFADWPRGGAHLSASLNYADGSLNLNRFMSYDTRRRE